MFQVVAARIPTTEEAQEMIRRGAGILAAILDWYEDGAAPCVTGVCSAPFASNASATAGLTLRGDHSKGDMQPEQQIGGGAALAARKDGNTDWPAIGR